VKVQKWKDFDLPALKAMFNGKLWTECRKPQVLHYPLGLLPEELGKRVVCGKLVSSTILMLISIQIVSAGKTKR
jgi:hypothetical protein